MTNYKKLIDATASLGRNCKRSTNEWISRSSFIAQNFGHKVYLDGLRGEIKSSEFIPPLGMRIAREELFHKTAWQCKISSFKA